MLGSRFHLHGACDVRTLPHNYRREGGGGRNSEKNIFHNIRTCHLEIKDDMENTSVTWNMSKQTDLAVVLTSNTRGGGGEAQLGMSKSATQKSVKQKSKKNAKKAQHPQGNATHVDPKQS